MEASLGTEAAEAEGEESGEERAGVRGTLKLITWCDGPYYCRNLWALGGRYVFYEDRAHNIFMCMWDAELLSLTVVAMPAVPQTRADTGATTCTTMVRDGDTVAFLGYSTQRRDATAATHTRLVIKSHTPSSRVFATLAASTLPLSLSTFKYMETTEVRLASMIAFPTLASRVATRPTGRAQTGDDIVLPDIPHTCRILSGAAALWLASDSGKILGLQRSA
jgi:hypothetical protein